MSAFHYKAEKIEHRKGMTRYRFFLNYIDREDLQGIAVFDHEDVSYQVESRCYKLTSEMRKREKKCLSAILHKLRKMTENGDALPAAIYHVG